MWGGVEKKLRSKRVSGREKGVGGEGEGEGLILHTSNISMPISYIIN